MVQDVVDEDEDFSPLTPMQDDGSTRGYFDRLPHSSPRRPLERLHTEVLLRMVLQDAQTRLVFRAQAMLAADVQYYSPRDNDLDYPEKLAHGERDRDSTDSGSKTLVPRPSRPDSIDDDDPAFLALPPPESQEGWYPTLRVTLWILSCLWSYVDVSLASPESPLTKPAVFEDLSTLR